MKKYYSVSLGILASVGLFIGEFSPNRKAIAQEFCIPLQEVTTGQTAIQKQIKNSVLFNNNWNTDFLVPDTQRFTFFVLVLTPDNNATYKGELNFKYSDTSVATVLNTSLELERERTYSRAFASPTGKQPFQINARIGGENNDSYTVSVLGCR